MAAQICEIVISQKIHSHHSDLLKHDSEVIDVILNSLFGKNKYPRGGWWKERSNKKWVPKGFS
jgi:hypothetical protein